jgi:hypothetical protein
MILSDTPLPLAGEGRAVQAVDDPHVGHRGPALRAVSGPADGLVLTAEDEMAARACATQVVAWPPSRTHKTTVSVVRYGQEIPTALDRDVVLSAKCLPARTVGSLPTDARWPMASASVFTVTVPSIQRELCARGVGVPASSWSTRDLTSGTKLASRAPSPRVQVNWRPGTDHQPHEPVKNDGWLHRNIRHLPDLYSSLPRQRDRMDRLLESAAATGTRSL